MPASDDPPRRYYVVQDEEGVYLVCDAPGPDDVVLLETDDLAEAERRLCREINLMGE